jgi:hypothetical protein
LSRFVGTANNTPHPQSETGESNTSDSWLFYSPWIAGQFQLIQQLEDDDKQTIFKLIEKMLTNKKFKDFFNKNVAML